ncbi:hypothetical protein [Ekhidna sp.]|uniref:hypothetical protein n=1 Tax=Ekhidna sp. TaxID=2608089 RepID=UPI003B513469
MDTPNQSPIPKWLTKLQQNSWEPEILLSGIVLYGMFKVPDILDEFLVFFKLNVFGNSQDVDNLVALFKMGIYWLITGLIMHLICRGVWIGMVGLSYTFPNGIQLDKTRYKSKFQDKVSRTPSFEQIVIKLEKISSSLFSISFMLFMSVIGGYMFFLVLIVLPFTILYVYFDLGFTGLAFEIFQVYVIAIVAIALIGLLDFVSLGYLRRFKWFVKIFWPFHKVISILTLSRFYRPIYYGVVTNFNKWVFFLFLMVFTFISIAGAGSMTGATYPGDPYSRLDFWGNARGYTAYSGYYDDQNQDEFSMRAHIPSDVINGNVLRLFVVANITSEEPMMEFMPLDSLREVYPDTARAALNLMIVKGFYTAKIDDKEVNIDRWYYHYKTQTKQRGYLTYIDISTLSEGMHALEVRGPIERYSSPFAVIPFYRDITLKQNQPVSQEKSEKKDADFQPKPFGIRE